MTAPELVAVAIATLCPSLVLLEFFRHGLQDFTGSWYWDGWNYIVYAQYLTDQPDETTNSPLYLQFIKSGMPTARSGAASLIAFVAHATSGEDAFAGFGLFLATCVFALACASGYAATALWSRNDWRVPLASIIAGTGLPVSRLIEVNNLDTLLLIALLPAALGLAVSLRERSRTMAIIFGLIAAALICVQPELAPFALLGPALIFAHCARHAWKEQIPWAAMAATAALIFTAPWLPGAAHLVLHLAASLLAEGSGFARPGNGYFQSFSDSACLLPSVWAIDLPYYTCAEFPSFFPLTVSILLSSVFIIGTIATWKDNQKSISLTAIILIGAALLSAFAIRYGYIAFKMIALAWPLMALLLASGVYQLVSAIASKSKSLAVVTVIIFFIPQVVLSANLSRDFYSRVVVKDISVFRSVKEIEPIVGERPILYALPTGDAFLWGLLFLRHSAFDSMILKNPFFNAAYRPENKRIETKADFILTESWVDLSCLNHREIWRHGPYVLWVRDKTQPVAFVSAIQHPNGLDREQGSLAIWLGGIAAKIEIWSDTATDAFLSADLAPGPSRPETTTRTVITSQAKWSQSVVISNSTTYRQLVHLVNGISHAEIGVEEPPSLTVLPSGDPRPLMVRLSDPRLCNRSEH